MDDTYHPSELAAAFPGLTDRPRLLTRDDAHRMAKAALAGSQGTIRGALRIELPNVAVIRIGAGPIRVP